MSPDRLNWSKLGEALVNWRLGGLYYKSAFGYVLAFILFVFGNLGTRLVSIFSLSKRIDLLSVFIWAVILAGITVPMVFLQKGTSWNTIQFFYYFLGRRLFPPSPTFISPAAPLQRSHPRNLGHWIF